MTPIRARTSAILSCAFLLLSCGGGGDGDDGGNNPPPPPPPSNLALLDDNVAEPAAETSLYSAEDGYYAMLLLTQAAQDLQRNQLDPLPYDCGQGGTVTLSANDSNDNGLLGSGDRVVITWDNCNLSASGSYLIEVANADFDSGVITALSGEFSMDITYHTGAEPTLDGSGDMEFAAAPDSLSWLATDFRVDWIDRTNRESLIDARIESLIDGNSGYSFAFSGTVESDAVGGAFEVATGPAFEGQGGQWPRTGMLTATGRDDSTLRYLADGASAFATLEVDADGNGVIDDVAQGIEWAEISSGVEFGIYGDPDVPTPPNGPDLIGRRIPLGGTAKDLAVNASRGHAYVTLPEQDELLVFSLSTLEVVRRVHLASQPAGLSVSPDGDEIFVGLSGAGTIAILDADSFAETRIFVAPELQSSSVYKIVETEPGILYASAGIADTWGNIVRVDRNAGTVTTITAQGFAEIELVADPTRKILFASDGAPADQPQFYKLDASVPATPSLQSFAITTGTDQMNRLSLNPAGNLMYASSGHVFDVLDLGVFGHITRGVPAASNNGTEALVALGERDLVIHSSATLQELDRLETNCWAPIDAPDHGNTFGQVQRLAQSSVNGQWLLLGEEVLCVVDLLNPDVPPGTGEPGVLPEPLPTVTMTTASVSWGNTISDVEYDDLRKRLYVSLYSVQELVTVDAENFTVLGREALGHTARGLDLSPDGSTLAIMFRDNGHIAFKDLASGTIETQDISSLLGTVNGYDVQWLDDDILFASADPECCEEPFDAFLVRVDRSDPGASRRSAGGVGDLWTAELAISPDRNFLYMGRGPSVLHKLDLTQAGEPIVRTRVDEPIGISSGGFTEPDVSPDGAYITFDNRKVLRTSDLYEVGQVAGNSGARFAADGATIFSGTGDFIDRNDPTTFKAYERMEPSGNCDGGWKFLGSADGTRLITVDQTRACFWLLDQPVVASVKLKAHDSYVCGAACMLRKLRKEAEFARGTAPSLRRVAR